MTQIVNARRELTDLIKARYPLVWCVTPEERRVEAALTDLCRQRQYTLSFWSIVSGWRTLCGALKGADMPDPIKACDYILNAEVGAGGVFVLCDFHHYLKDPRVMRKIREMIGALAGKSRTVIILSPILDIPRELDKEITVADWDLPAREEIGALLSKCLTDMPPSCVPGAAGTPEGREQVIDALIGLTYMEADNVLSKCLVRHKAIDIRTILGEKKAIIRKSGILEYYEAEQNLESVGGNAALKAWLRKRKGAFTQDARAYGLPCPKGLLLIGVPGCGKSLTAKAVSAAWGMPCLRLDIGKVFGSLVGDSEKGIRAALKTAEAVAPCVLWIDELEKAFAGAGSSGQNDSGVTARVFGTFITWMQEKTAPVFVIATANDVSGLPPELLRKGRFDEIFYSDLPSAEERAEILAIHLASKGRSTDGLDMAALMDATQEFTGSEIEQAVISALYEAYDANPADKSLNTEQIAAACRETVPLAHTMRERISAMREWARTRARSASGNAIPGAEQEQVQAPGSPRKPRRKVDVD